MSEKIVNIADSVTVGDLAEALGLPVTTLIGELFKNGIAATINQRLDFFGGQFHPVWRNRRFGLLQVLPAQKANNDHYQQHPR